MKGYKSETQNKNLAWFLPRPKPDHYKGGMPLHCEEWLIELAKNILKKPEATLLNVFCGMNKLGVRVDINPEVKPHYLADIHGLSKLIPKQRFDVILADPPYSNEESKELYGTGNLKYGTWTNECSKMLNKGGLLIVYHKFVMPNPNPIHFEVVKRVFIGNRPYHLPRVAIYFRKK